jgi:hypothetical protein
MFSKPIKSNHGHYFQYNPYGIGWCGRKWSWPNRGAVPAYLPGEAEGSDRKPQLGYFFLGWDWNQVCPKYESRALWLRLLTRLLCLPIYRSTCRHSSACNTVNNPSDMWNSSNCWTAKNIGNTGNTAHVTVTCTLWTVSITSWHTALYVVHKLSLGNLN